MAARMQPSAYLDMAAVEERHWWFEGRRRVLAGCIAGLGLRVDARILELGSGTGGNLALLVEFGEHLLAMSKKGKTPKDKQLTEMKKECQKSCFSTLNHILAFCYNDRRVINWMLKQAKHGFRRVEGNFGD